MNKPLIFDDGSKVFFTSDTHFGHANILKYCKRPFSSVEEMDSVMIERWNAKVGKDDTVFHLGDVSMGGGWDKWLNQLNGKIYLVVGNHDMRYLNDEAIKRFEWVGFQALITIEKRKVLLNHYPMLCYAGTYGSSKDRVYQLFGHVHSSETCDNIDFTRMVHLFPTQYDVGVDNNNFTPISFTEVDAIVKRQQAQK